jgi:hypothetical protein
MVVAEEKKRAIRSFVVNGFASPYADPEPEENLTSS